jgi:hypothetical protein
MVIQVGNVKGSAESNENLGPNRKNTNIRRNASEPQASSAPPIMRVVAGAGAAAPCMDRHERSQPADAGTVKVYILDQWWWWLEPVRLWPGFVSADGPINFHPASSIGLPIFHRQMVVPVDRNRSNAFHTQGTSIMVAPEID